MKIENSATNIATSSEKIITTKSCSNKKNKIKQIITSNFGWLDRKIEEATIGLRPEFSRDLRSISKENALTIANYILAMRAEINLSDTYRWSNISLLCKFSNYLEHKSFGDIDRDDILAYLNNSRKPEASDPLHKWIGTYNSYRVNLLRFFKWLYFPDVEPDKRPRPKIIENIQQLKRKEKSIYKPTDLWTVEDDLLFLRYCPSKRIKCFHVMAYDTGCRPHELLKLRIKDIVFKNSGDRQYAEVLVNGKTGSRQIPLIDSIPYIKDYLDHEHPQPGNPDAILICGVGKSLGRILATTSLHKIYNHDYKKSLFQKLLENPNVPPEDKHKIRELLKKPWNPYVRRHSALTEKSKILKEHTLRQFAGWTTGSNMPQKYLHYFGNEASESLLEAYGIVTKDNQLKDPLKPKQCPNCNEPNRPDSKFCAKCRMVLTYDAYNETLEKQQEKESEVQKLQHKYEQDMKSMRQDMEKKFQEMLRRIDVAKLT